LTFRCAFLSANNYHLLHASFTPNSDKTSFPIAKIRVNIKGYKQIYSSKVLSVLRITLKPHLFQLQPTHILLIIFCLAH